MNGWELKGLIYQCNARNNEEYRVELKKRQRLMVIFLLLGVLTLGTMITLLALHPEHFESYTAGFFSGVGIGLILGGLAGITKIRKTLNDEALLKQARLTETDEREQAISARALHTTLLILLLCIYLLLLLCAFVTIEDVVVLSLLVVIFFVSYLLSRKIYSRRM